MPVETLVTLVLAQLQGVHTKDDERLLVRVRRLLISWILGLVDVVRHPSEPAYRAEIC